MKIPVRKLEVSKDSRGTLFEVLRPEHVSNAPFGQVLVTTAKPGQTKGGHYHKRKREWYCVIEGKGLLMLDDKKNGQHAEMMLDGNIPMVVELPIGVFHKITNTGTKDLLLLVYVNEAYNSKDPDTFTV
jgi:UDP-2-acetamido-2,6-beta-L-arabino-hexul-4-ose reductase